MSLTDNRTHLQDCEAVAEVSTDSTADPQSNTNEAGVVIEGTNALQFQGDDAQEYLAYDLDAAAATFNLDLSDSTIYIMIKDNLHDSYAGLGAQIVMDDTADGTSTTTIGYRVAGYDVIGLAYEKKYSCYKLDVSVVVAAPGTVNVDFIAHNGTESNLDQTIIKQVGYGTIHLVKGQGTVPNAFFDGIYYFANSTSSTTGYCASILGGTSGTPETMTDLIGDDVTAGAGMFNNPKGSEFGIYAPTEWGDSGGITTTAFAGTDEQWYYYGDNGGGHAIGVTHIPMRLVGNSTGSNIFRQTRVVNINVGTRSQFYMDNADVDEITLVATTWIDFGVMVMPTNDASKSHDGTVWINCDQVDPSTMDMTDVTFEGSNDATGALLLDESSSSRTDIVGATFTSDGTGHGIQMAPTGAGPFTYNFDNFQNSGYGADDTTDAFVDINPVTSTVDITINLQNGAGTITTDQTGYTGTLSIIDAKTLTIAGLTEGAAAKIIANETVGTLTVGDVIMEQLANSAGIATIAGFNYEAAFGAGVDVIIRTRQQGLPNFGLSEDNAVFVDETTESNSSTTNDMNLLVDTSPVAGQDWFYFGHAEQFTRMKLDIGTVMAGGALLDFEYWSGAAWTNLSGVVDGTSDYTVSGESIISWTLPGDWATTSVDTKGPVYYIRIGYLSGTVSAAPRGRKCKLDVTRYIPFVQDNEITSSGLSTVASWAVDTIAKFDDAD